MSARGGFWRRNFGPASHALRNYWPAFLALQVCAGLLVAGYYAVSPVREAAHWLQGWKEYGGLLFVAAATVFSGALLPEGLKALLRPQGYRPLDAAGWLHLGILMAFLGIAVDAFYGFQSRWFGEADGAGVVVLKILVDQLLYAPLFALPVVLVWFAWKENGYDIRRTAGAVHPSFFLSRLPALYLPNLLFWVPSLAALYALPGELQFLLFIPINAAWCLLLVLIAREVSARGDSAVGVQARARAASSNPIVGAARQSDSRS